MTKQELIQMLADYPDDTEIYIDMLTDDQYETDNIWTSDVREPYDYNKPPYSKLRRVQDMKMAQRACKETAGAKKCLVL